MNSHDEIPVLNVMRDKLVAAIAEHPNRRRRVRIAPVLTAATGVAIVALIALFVVTQNHGSGRRLTVRGPLAGQEQTTTVTTAVPVPDTTTTTPPAPSTTIPPATVPPTSVATTLPPPATVTVTVADNGRTLRVRKGTTIQVQLNADPDKTWPKQPSSDDSAVVDLVSGTSSATSSEAKFEALNSGTAQLSALGAWRCPGPNTTPPPPALTACTADAYDWGVTIEVS